MTTWKDFGPVWVGSGTLGFYGEGWWFHPFYRLIFGERFSFEGATLVAKTTTMESRLGKPYGEPGNMIMKPDGLAPCDFFPDCIVTGPRSFWEGWMQNAVGLSGPGVEELFAYDVYGGPLSWRFRTEPFFFSFTSTQKGEGALQDARKFVSIFGEWKRINPMSSVGLQYNVSCPNTEHDSESVWKTLDILGDLGVPIVPKFGLTTSPEVARDFVSHPSCIGLHIANTVLFGETPVLAEKPFDWKPFAKKDGTSRLKKYGGGGLSGRPLLKPVCQWVRHARKIGIDKPINAGGGILSRDDVDLYKQSGADGVSFASAAVLRPWNVASIIERAHQLFT